MSEQSMNIIEGSVPMNAPGCCVFTGDIDGPFLDTKRWIPYADPYGYIHEPFCHEIGRAVGMVEGSEYEALKADLVDKQDLLAQFAAELEDLREQVKAVETVRAMVAA